MVAAACLVAAACADDPSDPCDFDVPGAPWVAYAAYLGGQYDLFAVRVDGTCRRTLAQGPGDDLYPTWSPGGLVGVASTRHGAQVIRLLDLASGADTPLAVGDLAATMPAFSPRGVTIAFEGRRPDGRSDIYVVPVGGGVPVNLSQDPAIAAGPAWSADGTAIYFVSTRTGTHEVFSVPFDGGAAAQVTAGARILGRPAVAPDGQSIAWARAAVGGTEVVRMELASKAVTVVTGPGDSEPCWDPDGGRLAVRSYRGGTAQIYLVGAQDGGAPSQLTHEAGPAGAAAFAPSPR